MAPNHADFPERRPELRAEAAKLLRDRLLEDRGRLPTLARRGSGSTRHRYPGHQGS